MVSLENTRNTKGVILKKNDYIMFNKLERSFLLTRLFKSVFVVKFRAMIPIIPKQVAIRLSYSFTSKSFPLLLIN